MIDASCENAAQRMEDIMVGELMLTDGVLQRAHMRHPEVVMPLAHALVRLRAANAPPGPPSLQLLRREVDQLRDLYERREVDCTVAVKRWVPTSAQTSAPMYISVYQRTWYQQYFDYVVYWHSARGWLFVVDY